MSTYIQTNDSLLSQLRAGDISYTRFIKESGHQTQFVKWCTEHGLNPDEEQAQLFFDQHGYDEGDTVKVFIEEF